MAGNNDPEKSRLGSKNSIGHQSSVARSRYELRCRLDSGVEIRNQGSFADVLRTFLDVTYGIGFKDATFTRIPINKRERR